MYRDPLTGPIDYTYMFWCLTVLRNVVLCTYQHCNRLHAGLVTFADGSHGMPRNEGYFEGDALRRQEKCPSAVTKGRQAADRARAA